jgi:hypothetical protein
MFRVVSGSLGLALVVVALVITYAQPPETVDFFLRGLIVAWLLDIGFAWVRAAFRPHHD